MADTRPRIEVGPRTNPCDVIPRSVPRQWVTPRNPVGGTPRD
ncbi:hypothetical protein [Lentzea aerocolonigenes]|nr:hypothetical protein [Lentzea aerocolonigenes]